MFVVVRCCLFPPSVRRSVLPLSSNANHNSNNNIRQQQTHRFQCRPFTLFALGNRSRKKHQNADHSAQPSSGGEPFSSPHSLNQCSSAMGVELPPKITERLSTLKKDVIDALLDKNAVPPELITSLMAGVGGSAFSKALELVPSYNQNLQKMAKYYFSAKGGKLIRPTVSLLMSAACNQNTKRTTTSTNGAAVPGRPVTVPFSPSVSPASPVDAQLDEKAIEISVNQYRIAMVAEMIHNATLVHDDVIDESDTRRGQPTANARWGNKQAVLVGDFILARATKVLCSIGEPPVIETMAEIVEDLVKGELLQLNGPSTLTGNARFNHYMVKTFYKTGSLFANSCRSVAMLSENCNELLLELATEFGRNLGLAFQLIDDILDYCATEEAMGKPTITDLRLGLATCPVLFAAEEFPEALNPMIERRFSVDGDVQWALELVQRSDGLAQSRRLAKEQGEKAIQCVDRLLPEGGHVRDCLVDIVQRQLARER